MQSALNLSQALLRIVFRRGSLQRVHYSNTRLLFALCACLVLLVLVQLRYFGNDVLDAGLLVFVCITTLLIAASWLTWKVPRKRLMTALLTSLLIAAAGLLILAAASWLPYWEQSVVRYGFAAVLAVLVLLGTSNCLQFALGSARPKAVAYTLVFALTLVLLYTTLKGLLQITFAA